MFVPKDDKLRHRILEVLHERDNAAVIPNTHNVSSEKAAITTGELAKQLGVTPDKIRQVTSRMQKSNEIKYDDFGEGECLYSFSYSATALFDRKYLKEGKKQVNDDIYDFTKWLIPLGLSIVTIYTTVIVTGENRQNRKRIENLQAQINSIKAQPTLSPLPKKLPDSLGAKRP